VRMNVSYLEYNVRDAERQLYRDIYLTNIKNLIVKV